MARKAHRNRGIGVRAAPHRAKPEPDGRRVRIGVFVGVGAMLVLGLAVAAVAFGAAFVATRPSTLPAGTQVFAENDHTHVTGPVTYDHLPPAGGPHNPVPLNCGVYTVPVPNENAVHSLEHGTVWITYQPNLAPDQVAILQQLVTSSYVGTERYLILSPYPGLPSPVVASAWGYQLSVQNASDSRLADFVHFLAGGGQGGEPGGRCTGGVGNPAE